MSYPRKGNSMWKWEKLDGKKSARTFGNVSTDPMKK